ncbi:AP-5 complex subunit beta-1 isoform X1 [Hypanus sabinus]|uniref:AP-5 complex subunit beta-1 isoform X1 n=2 Tax=Hypanus sabinus TaxID=79690 RepID=UPI0028C47D7B|nr:AP-5 complex subunit beta-1 isoform X1 [Hypanus sabinus]
MVLVMPSDYLSTANSKLLNALLVTITANNGEASRGRSELFGAMAVSPHSEWAQKVTAFRASPTRFLASTTAENFVQDLLRILTDEKMGENIKVQVLAVLQEFPTSLFTSSQSAERAVESIFNIYLQLPLVLKLLTLKCQLLLSVTTVVISTDHLISDQKVLKNLMKQLLDVVGDSNDHKNGVNFRPLRAMACNCLQEFETCYPGLLSGKLELLSTLRKEEVTPLHQAYTLLYSQALKNAIHTISQVHNASEGAIREMLVRNEGIKWKVMEKQRDLAAVTMTTNFSLMTSADETKELKSCVSLLLEECFLLTPVSQAVLLRELAQIIIMVHSLSPAIFRSQILRLFGTMDISLLHTILYMKTTFTDSLFTAEDENLLLKRLVVMAQHPLLNVPLRLFYLDCLLHFPENRPINSNLEENLPVTFTPRMANCLFPTLFNDSSTMLARLNLLSLVCLENTEEERGVTELFDYLMSLYKLVDVSGNRERIVTFFQAMYIFVGHFYSNEECMSQLTNHIVQLYKKHCSLAPHMINLLDSTQNLLEDCKWSVSLAGALQKLVVELPFQHLTSSNLMWHLKILARVAKESTIAQKATIQFLLSAIQSSDLCERGDWRMGNAILSVCRNILHCQNLEPTFRALADLLQHIHLWFQDIDIQDHAHLYYVLLTCLSGEKLARVVAAGPGNCSQAKMRSLSLMAESAGSSISVLPIKHPILQLTPFPKDDSPTVSPPGETSDQNLEIDYFEQYLEQFHDPGFVSTIEQKFYLSFTEEVDSHFHKLFTILVHFDLQNSHYESLSDLHVPCLLFNKEPHVFSLVFKPRLPFPFTLHTNAIFTTEDGDTYCSQLKPVDIDFPRLFLPFPVPLSWPSDVKASLFNKLWASLIQTESTQSALSRFCFKMVQRSLCDLVQSHFQKYVVSQHSEPESYQVFLFLPPRVNILFQLEQMDDIVKVDIVTNNWKLLPFINSYFLDMTSEK